MKNIVYRVSLVKRRFPVSLPSSVSFELLSTIDDVHESPPVAKNHGGSLMTKNERSEWKLVNPMFPTPNQILHRSRLSRPRTISIKRYTRVIANELDRGGTSGFKVALL